ncbi:alpha/beta hydrolase [Nannocystis punicea]|uniref:Alpha/beta hydrolase n=1 Tax=Nannocystis punicea TaxID=2995304 RepID=A0ABY7GUH3_9BACT|nr:alpha/beta hydrolase [Nannocystis poenicansa]WAS90578.1 alpha/beta hydrolase [Nannocystis poenicansa]
MKTTRALVDRELAPFLDAVAPLDFTPENLPEIRRTADATPPLPAPTTGAVTREEVTIPGRDGAPPVRALVYRPAEVEAGARLPAVLHLHGGGFVIWRPEINDARNRHIAADIGCVVVSVDYRLAPETAFPGPLEDCYTGLLWLHSHADALQVDPARIAVQGESAGGGLAAALALLARDRGEVPLAFQLLVYPMLDDRTGSREADGPNEYAGQFVWTPASNRFGWRAMLGHEPGRGDVSPYCAPARAVDLAGLPPTFMQVGALDLFVDEDIDYARRLLRAGVPTELHVYPGAFHGFDILPGTRIGAAFLREAHEALRRALAR